MNTHSGAYIRERVRCLIPNNEISPTNPYCLLVKAAGFTNRQLYFILVKSNGKRMPKKALKRIEVLRFSAYYGYTPKSSFDDRLKRAVELRDFYNIMHRIAECGATVTPELIASVTDPERRQELVKAVCLKQIRRGD